MLYQKIKHTTLLCLLALTPIMSKTIVAEPSGVSIYSNHQGVILAPPLDQPNYRITPAEQDLLQRLSDASGEAFLTLLSDRQLQFSQWLLVYGPANLLDQVYSEAHLATVAGALKTEFDHYGTERSDTAKLHTYEQFMTSYADFLAKDKKEIVLSSSTANTIQAGVGHYFSIDNIFTTPSTDGLTVSLTTKMIVSLKMSGLYLDKLAKFLPDLLNIYTSSNKPFAQETIEKIAEGLDKVDESRYGDWKNQLTGEHATLAAFKNLLRVYAGDTSVDDKLLRAALSTGTAIGKYATDFRDAEVALALTPVAESVIDLYAEQKDNIAYFGVANQITQRGQCKKFKVCGWTEKAVQDVLPVSQQCSVTAFADHITIRAQTMTPSEFSLACRQINTAYQRMTDKTGVKTRAEDNINNKLIINVFNDSQQYHTYGNVLLGAIAGGVYYSPADRRDANAPGKIVVQKQPYNNNEVYALQHEVGHYLFDQYLRAYGATGDKLMFFNEGFAEYLEKVDSYEHAFSVAKERKYDLKTIISDYDYSDTAKVYQGGYTVVRYLFDNHSSQMSELIGYMRQRNSYAQSETLLANIESQYNQHYQRWIKNDGLVKEDPNPADCTGGACDPNNPHMENGVPKVGISAQATKHYAIWVPMGTRSVVINTMGQQGGVDVYAKYGSWPNKTQYDVKETSPGVDHNVTAIIPEGVQTQDQRGDYLYITLYPQTSFQKLDLVATYAQSDTETA